MSGLLVQHALDNIWCEPTQDRQHIIQGARLTGVGGTKGSVLVLHKKIKLPEGETKFFHVYQVGSLNAGLFDISIAPDTWLNIADITRSQNVIVDMVFANGAKVPPYLGYIRRGRDGNIIVAIVHYPLIDYSGYSLDTNSIYFRVYSNARFETVEWRTTTVDPINGIALFNKLIASHADFLLYQQALISIDAKYAGEGINQTFVDGYLQNIQAAYDESILGKHITLIRDTTIKSITDFNLATLPEFTSTLDINKAKYLLVPDNSYNSIDYYDDVDVYIVKYTDTGYKGIRLLKLRGGTMRNVTHNAYSLLKTSVDEVLALNSWLTDDVYIRLVVRQGGFNRGLRHQHNRIEELYRLGVAGIREVMINGPVSEWRAGVLEASDYCRIMRSEYDELTTDICSNGYGYNAATRALANPICEIFPDAVPYTILPGVSTVPDLNDGLGKRAIFHYTDGLCTGYVNDSSLSPVYYSPEPFVNGDFIECFNATVKPNITGAIYDTDVTDVSLKQYGFRCYVTPFVGLQPSGDWYDVTDSVYYTYSPNGNSLNGYIPTVEWNYTLLAAANLFPCVKINDTIYHFTPPPLEPNYTGLIQFELTESVLWFGSVSTVPYKLPAGVVDVFMDGESLISELDYYIDGSIVTIVRKPNTAPMDTAIFVRSYGFPIDEPIRPDLPRDFGFVKGGLLSVNGRYDIRNDRNIRSVVAGRVRLRNEVKYAEEGNGGLSVDGRPYAINDYAVGVENFSNEKLVPFRLSSIDLDNRVIDYLTSVLDETTVRRPTIITERWAVVSPFASVIMHALLDGFLNTGELNTIYTKVQTDVWLSVYLDILDADPCIRNTNLNYVLILPHQYDYLVTVSSAQYRFLEFIVLNYLNNRIDLTPSVVIG